MEKLSPFEELNADVESAEDFIKKDLFSLLENIHNPQRDEIRQAKTIKNMPEDLTLELRGHIEAAYVEDKKYDGKFKGKKISELSEEEKKAYELQILRGELFEMLIKYDPEFINSRSQEGDELLSLLHDPERFGLKDKVGSVRNPDLAYIELNEEGRVIIKGVGEAKLGLLGERAISQLRSFDDSVKILKSTINGLKHAKKMKNTGFEGLARRKEQMDQAGEEGPFFDIDEQFKTTLIVPSNREVERGYLYDNLVKRTPKNLQNKKEIQDVLGRIDIKQSAFNVEEVAALAKRIHELI